MAQFGEVTGKDDNSPSSFVPKGCSQTISNCDEMSAQKRSFGEPRGDSADSFGGIPTVPEEVVELSAESAMIQPSGARRPLVTNARDGVDYICETRICESDKTFTIFRDITASDGGEIRIDREALQEMLSTQMEERKSESVSPMASATEACEASTLDSSIESLQSPPPSALLDLSESRDDQCSVESTQVSPWADNSEVSMLVDSSAPDSLTVGAIDGSAEDSAVAKDSKIMDSLAKDNLAVGVIGEKVVDCPRTEDVMDKSVDMDISNSNESAAGDLVNEHTLLNNEPRGREIRVSSVVRLGNLTELSGTRFSMSVTFQDDAGQCSKPQLLSFQFP